MLKLKGNLITMALEGNYEVIVHGCNCFCNMGAGIAKEIKARLPAAYEADCRTIKGDPRKLGTFSMATVSIGTNKSLTVLNAYTQYYYGGKKVNVDYAAIRKVAKLINRQFQGKIIGLPLIGAGLAGGDWARIEKILDEEFTSVNAEVVLYDPAQAYIPPGTSSPTIAKAVQLPL